MNHITAPGKKARGRLSGFSVAFIILFVLFFAAGFGSLGSFRSTGKAFSYVSGDNNIAVFNLEMTDKQSKLTAVYVNVGNVYTELGADTKITVKRTNSLDTKPGITVGEATIGNIYSKKDKTEGANFNWISIATGKDKLDASAKRFPSPLPPTSISTKSSVSATTASPFPCPSIRSSARAFPCRKNSSRTR